MMVFILTFAFDGNDQRKRQTQTSSVNKALDDTPALQRVIG